MKVTNGGTDETKPEFLDPASDPTDGHSRKRKPNLKVEQALRSKLEKIENELHLVRDRHLRDVAELVNVRKRMEREKNQLVSTANAELIRQLLPVVDDLERSFKSPLENEGPAFRDGIDLIRQKLETVLKNRGLESIETVGRSFDVRFHDAVLQTTSHDVAPGTVVEEYQKGYLLNGQVLRHAKVAVSRDWERGGAE